MVTIIYLFVASLMFVAWGQYIDDQTKSRKSAKRFYGVMQVVFAITNAIYLLLAIQNANLILPENILKEGGEVVLYVLYGLPLLLCVADKILKRIKKGFIIPITIVLWIVYAEIALIVYISTVVYMLGIC